MSTATLTGLTRLHDVTFLGILSLFFLKGYITSFLATEIVSGVLELCVNASSQFSDYVLFPTK